MVVRSVLIPLLLLLLPLGAASGADLLEASEKGDVDQVAALLDGGADVNAAAREGHVDAAKVLIDRRIDVNARNERGQTALHLSLAGKHERVSEALRAAGGAVVRTTRPAATTQAVGSVRGSP